MRRRGCIVATVFSLIMPLQGCSTPQAQDRDALLPEPVAGLFPGYVLMAVADFDPLLRQVLNSEDPYPDGQSPTWLRADFDGNVYIDHAMLLRTPSGADPKGEIFAIVLEFDGGQYEVAYSQSFDYVLDYALLSPVDAGTLVRPTQAFDTGKEETRLSNAAITLSYFEKSSVVHYWDDTAGRFDEIWTSD